MPCRHCGVAPAPGLTTRQLMGHIAGIRQYRGDESLRSKHYDGVVQGLEIFANDSLLFRPGTAYSYSTYDWNLVSAVVEATAGEPFLDFMRREVFPPLGLRHTVPGYMASIIPDHVRFYEHDEEGRLVNAPYDEATPMGMHPQRQCRSAPHWRGADRHP